MPMLDCSPHVRQGVAHGVGIGFSFDSALDMAETIASIVARNQAANWDAAQTCPANCPKHPAPGGPNLVIGGVRVRLAVRPFKMIPGLSTFAVVEVTLDWIAWFVCGTLEEAATYTPPLGAVPEQYKHGVRPVAPPNF